MREDSVLSIGKLIAGMVARSSLASGVAVRLCRGMQGQTEDEVHRAEGTAGPMSENRLPATRPTLEERLETVG